MSKTFTINLIHARWFIVNLLSLLCRRNQSKRITKRSTWYRRKLQPSMLELAFHCEIYVVSVLQFRKGNWFIYFGLAPLIKFWVVQNVFMMFIDLLIYTRVLLLLLMDPKNISCNIYYSRWKVFVLPSRRRKLWYWCIIRQW